MNRGRSVVMALAAAVVVLPPAAVHAASQQGGSSAPPEERASRRAEQDTRLQEQLRAPRPIEALESVWIEELTWMEVRDALAAGKTTAIIATGGIEQNGPYLATGKHHYVLDDVASSLRAHGFERINLIGRRARRGSGRRARRCPSPPVEPASRAAPKRAGTNRRCRPRSRPGAPRSDP